VEREANKIVGGLEMERWRNNNRWEREARKEERGDFEEGGTGEGEGGREI
jgi:hypothetical protein